MTTSAAANIMQYQGGAGSPPGSGAKKSGGSYGGKGGSSRDFIPLSAFFLGAQENGGKSLRRGRKEPFKKRRITLDMASDASAAMAPWEMKPVAVNKSKEESGAALAGQSGPVAPPTTMSGNVAFVPIPIGSGDSRKFIDSLGVKSKKKRKLRRGKTPMLRRR